ncbi:uncharacterized protein LOC131160077 [Malania oleifera]|uniref:uncharacterized protein LOC131160077 n=1 Tax=Malania oleifera TaxID=397392 RepID=UPI0025AE8D16|nr:uncharacterized protein LOC131160077 [Malania oleifera]
MEAGEARGHDRPGGEVRGSGAASHRGRDKRGLWLRGRIAGICEGKEETEAGDFVFDCREKAAKKAMKHPNRPKRPPSAFFESRKQYKEKHLSKRSVSVARQGWQR